MVHRQAEVHPRGHETCLMLSVTSFEIVSTDFKLAADKHVLEGKECEMMTITVEPDTREWRVRRFMHTLERLAMVMKTEREALGWSVAELAAAGDTTVEVVEAIEAGHPTVGIPTTGRLLWAMGVKPLALPAALYAIAPQ